MREYHSGDIRNVAVVGHGGSGKTTLVDALCFAAGTTKRRGTVRDGTALTDYVPEEVERKHSIAVGCAFAEWMDTKVNLLDAPGFADFQGDAIAALAAADGALVCVPATGTVEVGTERMFAEAVARGIEDAHPALATTAHTKERRGPRVLVDFRQNRQGSTIASVYSPRPRAGAPVSTPLRWEEVEPGLDPARFSFEAVLERCREHGDLFEPVLSLKQQMADAVARLPEISYE